MNSFNNNIHLFTVLHGLNNYNPQKGQKILLYFCLGEEDLLEIIDKEIGSLKKAIIRKNSKLKT